MDKERVLPHYKAFALALQEIEKHFAQHPRFPTPDYRYWHDGVPYPDGNKWETAHAKGDYEKLEGLDSGDADLAFGLRKLARSALCLCDWIEAHSPPAEVLPREFPDEVWR